MVQTGLDHEILQSEFSYTFPLSQVNTDADEVQEEADPQFVMNDAPQNDTGRPKATCTCSASPLAREMGFDFVKPIPVIIPSQDYAELML